MEIYIPTYILYTQDDALHIHLIWFIQIAKPCQLGTTRWPTQFISNLTEAIQMMPQWFAAVSHPDVCVVNGFLDANLRLVS